MARRRNPRGSSDRRRPAGVVILMVLLSGGMFAGPSRAQTFLPPVFERVIGGPGHAGVYPWGAATATDGTILIGDYWNYSVRRFDTEGNLLQTFAAGKGGLPGQNRAPHGLAVDPTDGSVYLSDLNSGQIDKFDSAGNYVLSFYSYVWGVTASFYTPRMAVNSEGSVYVVNSHTLPSTFVHQILVFDSNGVFKSVFGTVGTEDGEFGVLRGIDIGPNDEVYISDSTKKSIQVFDKDGNFLRRFGGPGTEPGRFGYDMRGLAVDHDDGWVYAVDSSQSQIEKFDLEGNHLATFGSEGTGPGQFRDGGREITIGPDNNLYAPDFAANRVNVFSPDGEFLRDFPNPPPEAPDGGFNLPQGVAVDPSGANAYVVDTYNHRIQKFDKSGNFVAKWGFRGSTDPFALNYPRGVAIDPSNGDVWVNNTREGNIKVYTAGGEFVRTWAAEGIAAEDYSRGIWVGKDGRVFITNSFAGTLIVTDRDGNKLMALPCGGSPTAIVSGCTGVTQDAAGNIYAAVADQHKILKYSPSGTLVKTWGAFGTTNGKLSKPYDVEVYNNRVYVSESGNHRISIFNLNGVYVGKFGRKGTGDGFMREPRSISIDKTGRLYVADSLNERIQVFRIR